MTTVLHGLIRYGVARPPLPEWKENTFPLSALAPNAFRQVLAGHPDVELQMNHKGQKDRPHFGGTWSGELTLCDHGDYLTVTWRVPSDIADRVQQLHDRGRLTGVSYMGGHWPTGRRATDGAELLVIASLSEISVLVSPFKPYWPSLIEVRQEVF